MEMIGAIILFLVAAIFAGGLIRYAVGANQMASYEPSMYVITIGIGALVILVCVSVGVALL